MIERRDFLKKMALLASAIGGSAFLSPSGKAAEQEIGIAVVEGENPAGQVREAIRLLGGIERFVRRGDRVVLLSNPQEVPHIQPAHESGLGKMTLGERAIKHLQL